MTAKRSKSGCRLAPAALVSPNAPACLPQDELEPLLASRPAAAWSEQLQAARVPAGPVHDIGQALGLAARLGLDPVVEVAGDGRTSRQVANPITLSRTPVRYDLPPPDLAEHQDAAWLDL